MTETQVLSHQEQMDVLRREFSEWWKREWPNSLAKLQGFEEAPAMHIAWRAYAAAIGLKL